MKPLPRIGPYVASAVLGQGAMGTVYLAHHPDFGELAIKVLSSQGATQLERARFRREVRALRRLDHPGLVRVVDEGEAQGLPWFAMLRVQGGSLDEHLHKQGPLSEPEARELGLQLCAALEVAHAENLLHRDLKPSNVLCAPGGRYLITDFGLAKELAHEVSVNLTQTGTLQGTPCYWAPEQATGQGSGATPRTDVYGVGAVLYAALTGRGPIQGDSLAEIVVATVERPPDPPSLLAAVSDALDAIVLRCLRKDPQDRYASIAALAQDLSETSANGARADSPASASRRLALVGVALTSALLLLLFVSIARDPSPEVSVSPSPSPSLLERPAQSVPPAAAAEPAWFHELPSGRRPPLPLPEGLSFGTSAGEYLNVKDGSTLVWVWKGSFLMGSDSGRYDERPPHVVTLRRGFFMGKHEVSRSEYERFCRESGLGVFAWLRDMGIQGADFGPKHPLSYVTCTEALAYCAWAGLRLPSEAEWEYSARGPESTSWPWGEADPSPKLVNLSGRRAATEAGRADWHDGHEVQAPRGSFPAGASVFGCQDLAGNVAEHVMDAYHPNYRGSPRDGSAWVSGGASYQGKRLRVARGGSWYSLPSECRPAYREGLDPDRRYPMVGFRVARSAR